MAVVLLVAGLVSGPLQSPAWRMVRSWQPALHLRDLEAGLGQGVTLGLVGGFRSVIADMLWLKTDLTWEARDLPATQTLIKLVTAVDPRPLYFWLNGSRMIAYDMPYWRYAARGGERHLSKETRDRISDEQATVALDYLHRGLQFHPGNPYLYIEIANIYLRRLHDLDSAAGFYRKAAEEPGAPFYAARIYAELLKRLGRPRDAYDWLVKLYPTLPDHDPRAMKPVVLARIRDLESKLGIPDDQRFVPPVKPVSPGKLPR